MKLSLLKPLSILAIIFAFLFLPFCKVLQNGLCCYDDVGYALVAKNIAAGIGYATTMSYIGSNYAISHFDYALGQGPVGILPTALAFRLFGVNPFIPGIVQILFECILLCLIAWRILKEYSLPRTALFLFSSLLLITLISGNSFEHWHTMLGESLAALFIMLAFAFLLRSDRLPASPIYAGLCLGLSVLTKEIAAIFVITFSIYSIAKSFENSFTHDQQQKNPWKSLFYFAVAGITPFIAFETWRFATLGRVGYFRNWNQHIHFIASYSPKQSESRILLNNLTHRLDQFGDAFYIPLLLLTVLTLASMLLSLSAPRTTKQLTTTLGCGILLYFAYWIFSSTGPARHIYIGIIIACFLIPFPILIQKKLFYGILPFLILASFLAPLGSHYFSAKTKEVFHTVSHPESSRQIYAAEHDILHHIQTAYPRTTILIPWWAHGAMVEFLSPRWSLFWGWDRLKQQQQSIVLINKRLAALCQEEDAFATVLQENNCKPAYGSGEYTLYACDKNS